MSDLLERETQATKSRFFITPEMRAEADAIAAIAAMEGLERSNRPLKRAIGALSLQDIKSDMQAVEQELAGWEDAACRLGYVDQLHERLSVGMEASEISEAVVIQAGDELAGVLASIMQEPVTVINEQAYYYEPDGQGGRWLTCWDDDRQVVYFNRPDLSEEDGSREASLSDYVELITNVEAQFAAQAV